MELVRYGFLIVYGFGFGLPIVIYLVTKFLGSKLFSLAEVLFCYYKLAYLHLWLLFFMFYPCFLALYHTLGLVTLDSNGLRHVKLYSILSVKYE